jgi:hypothetical protein
VTPSETSAMELEIRDLLDHIEEIASISRTTNDEYLQYELHKMRAAIERMLEHLARQTPSLNE